MFQYTSISLMTRFSWNSKTLWEPQHFNCRWEVRQEGEPSYGGLRVWWWGGDWNIFVENKKSKYLTFLWEKTCLLILKFIASVHHKDLSLFEDFRCSSVSYSHCLAFVLQVVCCMPLFNMGDRLVRAFPLATVHNHSNFMTVSRSSLALVCFVWGCFGGIASV